MPDLHYAVTAFCPSAEVADEYAAWLTTGGHLQAVLDGGADRAAAVRLDPTTEEPAIVRVVSLYRFSSREAFARYESDHAPRLRADGLGRFGDRGIRFERQVGEVLSDA